MDLTDFTGIMKGGTPLVKDVDYTVVIDEEDDRVFITLKEYLSEQPIGSLILDFQFSKGYPCPVELTIKDTSAPPLMPTMANAANNSVNASPSTVPVGGSVTLTATGDRQSATGAVVGDEKFVPINWVSTEVGKAGSFTLTDGIYTSAYTPSAAGNYNVNVSYQKQTWNGSIWTTSVAGDSKSTTVTVNTASTATTANAANNSVGASQSSITAGGTVTLTATGDLRIGNGCGLWRREVRSGELELHGNRKNRFVRLERRHLYVNLYAFG